MRVLLDACVPRGLRKHLVGHDVGHAPEMGWGDLNNGDLLDAMAGRFEVLVTTDKGIPAQQRIGGRSLGIIVLRARTNRLQDLLPLVPKLLASLIDLEPRTVSEIAS
ncbi:MAG: DUF5615 family PIN-like protein [Acidobacteria bacterium]|nr:DUF5615 family PIN-like protein [Acidobacteriota bacterium]